MQLTRVSGLHFSQSEEHSMVQRVFYAILALTILLTAGCGERKDKGHSSPGVPTSQAPAPEPGPAPSPGAQLTPARPTSEFLSPDPLAENTEPAPLLVQEQRETEIPEYNVPESIRERLARDLPDYNPRRTEAFKVLNHHLNVNQRTSTMTFTGTLRIPGKQDEPFELTCQFDKAKSWACGNMYPANPVVRSERRIQASANCTDVYRCDRVGVELFVLINGKIESQLFQSSKFEMRRAEAGDIPDYEGPAPKPDVPDFVPPQPGQPVPLPREKPRPDPAPPAPQPEQTGAISEEELRRILDDSNAAVDIIAPLPVPRPTGGEFSIPNIETLRPVMGNGVKNQAIGMHYNGHLESAAQLPKTGSGFLVRDGRDRSFGTDSMIGLIKDAAAQVEKKAPGKPPFVIADVAQRYGGRLSNRSGRFHSSHQTGLDADIAFPSRRPVKDLWPAARGASISDNLDEERLWMFLTALTCAEKSPVIVIFVDSEIKQHMCRWAKRRQSIDDPSSCAFKTLRALKYSPGHHDHMHVRLRCPGNSDCRDATVSLGRSTGC